MPEIKSDDILNEKVLEIILNYKPSEKHDKTAVNEILKLKGDIKKAIPLLSKPEQEILELRYSQNFSDDTIAKQTSKSTEEVRKIIL